MGVKFKDITTAEPIEMNDLKGKILTVDASNLIYKFLSTMRQADGTPLKDSNGNITSHLSGIFFQTATLISKQVKPVYVFDGKSPQLKSKTVQERIEVKKESEKKYLEAKESGDMETARKYASRTVHLDKEIIESSKKLLELMGLPYVQAKTEGEAQASYMVAQKDAWAVVSQDYDCLQFGATRMLRNFRLSQSSKNMEIISLQKTLDDLKLTREQMVDLAMLVGTDFNEGVYGIGAKKGLKLMQKYGTLETALEKLDKTIEVDPDEIREIFLNPDVITDYKITFKTPKKEKLIDFLCGDHDFNEERTLASIDKLKKETAQTSLNQWF
ncbi:MAG: flap endonuclease-1 [Methanosphaera sp.]|uniref:flap endonuclease-1 n=1 Tax=Methanosphaera sp. ISO3-F5 TaxID=1452353 RepID=UPI002B262BE3|nr:flap endonuclease-1 [Methanosphaera sp. ISO3-F5]MBR0471995.1 flap endonuclease-1 [Methanosphaera sp.]WQH64625.1 flap endonuclease-1 [Methanosphaera sp. ISO3-F5]